MDGKFEGYTARVLRISLVRVSRLLTNCTNKTSKLFCLDENMKEACQHGKRTCGMSSSCDSCSACSVNKIIVFAHKFKIIFRLSRYSEGFLFYQTL